MRTIPLTESRAVVLDGSGNGLVSFAPTYSERWHPSTVSVTIPSPVVVPQAFLYVGDSPSPGNEVDSTLYGSQNVSDALSGMDMQPGTQVFVKWIGGDPGATATANLRGTKDIP